jgi:hypothetical protein
VLDRGPILTRIREAREGRAAPPSPEELQAMMAEGLADSRRQLQRLFYDTTLSANDTVLDCLARLVPSTQLLLGTDYPMARRSGSPAPSPDSRATAASTTTIAARKRPTTLDASSHAWPPRPSAPRTIPQGQEASNAQAVHLRHKPTTARAAIRERASWR